ncbi:MAG: Lrp/AsnC ligand binding domain-containing protein [Candidatus Hodarchaeales archaeon]
MSKRAELAVEDRRILATLFNRETLTLRGIPDQVGISSRSFFNKVRALRKEGIITGWPVIINPWSTGGFRVFFFFIKTNPKEPAVMEQLQQTGGIYLESLDGITGEQSLLAKFSFQGRDEKQVLDFVSRLDKIASKAKFQSYRIIEALSIYKHCGFEHEKIDAVLKENQAEFLRTLAAACNHSELPPTTAEIAALTGKDQSTASRMLNRLLKTGVITAFSVKTRTGYRWSKFHVSIKAQPSEMTELVKELVQWKEITSLYRTGQDYSLLLTAFLPRFDDFSNFLKQIYQQEGVVDTFSFPVLDSIKDNIEPLELMGKI